MTHVFRPGIDTDADGGIAVVIASMHFSCAAKLHIISTTCPRVVIAYQAERGRVQDSNVNNTTYLQCWHVPVAMHQDVVPWGCWRAHARWHEQAVGSCLKCTCARACLKTGTYQPMDV
eukprot:362939-Chlamydomonas_euryale.AAC.4